MMHEMLQRFGKRDLAIILSLFCMVLVSPMVTYLVWPNVKNFRAVATSRDSLVVATANKGELETQLDLLRSRVSVLQRKLHGDMANLPPKEVEAYIIGRLQAISWRNNVELVGVEPGRGEVIEAFREMLFKVSLAGDYFDLYSWLQDLGDELGFVVIKQYEMSPVTQNERNPRLAAELTIASYRTFQ